MAARIALPGRPTEEKVLASRTGDDAMLRQPAGRVPLPEGAARSTIAQGLVHTSGMKPASRLGVHNRRKVRLGLRVIHRHRVGSLEFRRVSELVYVQGRPKAILGWIDVGGVRTPIFLCDLDPGKLRKATGHTGKNLFYYDAVTVDPRYEQLVPAAAEKR